MIGTNRRADKDLSGQSKAQSVYYFYVVVVVILSDTSILGCLSFNHSKLAGILLTSKE